MNLSCVLRAPRGKSDIAEIRGRFERQLKQNSVRSRRAFRLRFLVLMRAPWITVFLCVFFLPPFSHAQNSTATQASQASAQTSSTTRPVTSYTLPPELYRKARNLSKIRFRVELLGTIYGLLVLWIVLRLKLAPKYRDWAEAFSKRTFLQSLVFAPLLLLSIAILTLPLDIYGESVEKQYGLSVQGWQSWAWDWTKAELISLVLGIVLIWLLYLVIRRSARRWWFYFWLISLPIGVALFFIGPWVIDPMFHKFEPLQQKNAELTASLEKMVQRASENIPPERMFWMDAGEKTTGLNAYVTGIGASKRIVVWDTTIAKMNTQQIVFVAGHETGHYVLQHIPKGLTVFAIGLLILFYLGYRFIGWLLGRWGTGWGVRSLEDWASLPVLMLLLSIFSFIATPVGSSFSRYLEHQADQYGLEVTHGLTPDSGEVAAQSFQILGEVDLSDPAPNPVQVFLFYDHPSIPDRIRFCLTYDPWAHGGHGEFVQ